MATKQPKNPKTAIRLHGSVKDRNEVIHILMSYKEQRHLCSSTEGKEQLKGKIQQLEVLLYGGEK